MVFQEFALFPHMSVLENVVYALRIKGEQNCEKKGREMLDEVGLSGWGEVSPSELSGGMKQRVGVARAFVTNSDVVLMDEPFSALDPLIRREMQEWFLDELKHKFEFERTIFFITHDLQEALRVGDRIAIMKEGQMVQIGSPQDILQNPADEYVQAFVQDIKELAEEGDLF
jgi:glycine betaine/proline transport system ATP-binding protein